MTFGEVLRDVRGCRGVLLTTIADRDGIPVESWGRTAREIEDFVAEFSTFLREVASANRELQLGDLEQMLIAGVKKTVVVTRITPEYFLLSVVDHDGNSGRLRFVSRVAAERLRHEFV